MNKKILDIIKESGIIDAGFCAFDEVSQRLLECRAKQRIPQGAKTVICCIFPYKVSEKKPVFLSRYAAVPDYHTVCGGYLERAAEKLRKQFPENRFEVFIDNSPIPEVFAAATAGLGVKGKNGLLITKEYGSFVFLGEIVTDMYIETQNLFGVCCGCGKCLQNCPKAVAGVCLSALSQKKGELSPQESRILRDNGILWGCDICAESCPENIGAKITPIPEFKENYRDFFRENEDMTDRAYIWRGKGVILRNFANLKKED